MSRQYYDSLHTKLYTLRNLTARNIAKNSRKSFGKLGNVPTESFTEYFKELCQKPTENCAPHDQQFDPRNVASPTNEHINGLFTLEELQHIIKRLKNKEARVMIT